MHSSGGSSVSAIFRKKIAAIPIRSGVSIKLRRSSALQCIREALARLRQVSEEPISAKTSSIPTKFLRMVPGHGQDSANANISRKRFSIRPNCPRFALPASGRWEGNDDGWSSIDRTVNFGSFGPVDKLPTRFRFFHLATVFWLMP